jgi:hypothetical protein
MFGGYFCFSVVDIRLAVCVLLCPHEFMSYNACGMSHRRSRSLRPLLPSHAHDAEHGGDEPAPLQRQPSGTGLTQQPQAQQQQPQQQRAAGERPPSLTLSGDAETAVQSPPRPMCTTRFHVLRQPSQLVLVVEYFLFLTA